MSEELIMQTQDAAGTFLELGNPSYLGKGDKGDDGIGIVSIIYKERTEQGNVYTVTLTDGTSYDITAPKGEQGIPGTNGADGQDGADGKSAYASARDGGYVGTEQQFNSDLADVGEKTGEAPDDGQQYARKNKAWAVVQGGGGASTWANIIGKPFESLGTTMKVENGVLDVYISETANPHGGNTLSIG